MTRLASRSWSARSGPESRLGVAEGLGKNGTAFGDCAAAAALTVVVVNPRHVRHFARATGPLAKTDTSDTEVLAHSTGAGRPSVRFLRDAKTLALNSLVARKHQMMTTPVSEKNRLGTTISAERPRIGAHIVWLDQEPKDLDERMR